MFLQDYIGNTPLVTLQRLGRTNGNVISVKLEGNNPAGSVKDRAAYSMIRCAEERGEIKPGDRLVEATSGNTGIALAMVAAIKGYHMTLIMPENMTEERVAAMRAYGAEIVLVPGDDAIMRARDMAEDMHTAGEALAINQFSNPDNPLAHYETTAQEIWQQTGQSVTHFVSSMGTTGTIMGCARFFAEAAPHVQIIGVQPEEGSSIPGIRRWPPEYVPAIYDPDKVHRIMDVSRADAEDYSRRLAREEGIFCGISAGGAMCVAVRLANEISDAHIVSIVCDRGDRYLSTGIFSD